jgi:hypothetical protein
MCLYVGESGAQNLGKFCAPKAAENRTVVGKLPLSQHESPPYEYVSVLRIT